MSVDIMHEGYLVKGTLDPAEAVEAIFTELDVHLELSEVQAVPDTYRKVPGQWSPWILVQSKPGRGAFQAVAVYNDGRHKWAEGSATLDPDDASHPQPPQEAP